jgi:multidrug efflux pump subunit AcrA (membrane-fusion protein)
MKTKTAVTLSIAAVIAAGLVFIPSMVTGQNSGTEAGGTGREKNGSHTSGETKPAAVFSVRTSEAEIRNLQAYMEVNGNIISEQQVAVVPEASGKLVSMKAALGSTVGKGDLLAEVDPSRPGAEYALSPVYAPVSGVVASNPVSIGSTVSTGTTLLTLAASGSLEIEALIPEREVGQLHTGLRAAVRLEAFPGESFAAELTRLSPVIDPASRTKKITLKFLADDPRINAGMFARVKLNTRSYENVISIPQQAVTDRRGSTVVYVVNTDTINTDAINGDSFNTPIARMREVSLGVSIDGEVEIRDGISAGEAVVVQGQQFLTDGAAVRIIGQI